MDMQNIQNVLLLFAVIFSVLTAIALYAVLSGIFKPLIIVDSTSRKIADGQYSERIRVKGENELSRMAFSFNRMAEEIEKQMRVLEDEAAAKQQFADNLAHEIRTPLTSIYGYAEYLQKASLDEEEVIIEYAQYIMDESGHIKRIANSLLELATLRNYTPEKNQISIPRLFDDISRLMEKPLKEHNIRLVCRTDTDVLYGQEDLIKSLLINLCFNALKARPHHEAVIYLSADKQDDNIILSVKDSGCGIPEDSIKKVTEPFYRVDKARSREQSLSLPSASALAGGVGGAGLGLTLCKQIAEAHNAKINIESVVGVGTTVNITFTSS
jgi:signal transduction histidine kinase